MLETERRPRQQRLSRDVVAGNVLIAVALAAFVGVLNLPTADGTNVGPGMMPKATAVLIGCVGVIILITGLFPNADRLGRWSLRGPLFVLGAVVLFAATVRTLGLAVAGPLAIIVSAFADKESRVVEVLIFAAVLTGLAVGLFKYALRLPIPLAPFIMGY